eukprot:scaffold7521_cov69-Phaeocystis_antarctica.AAC.2
MRTVQIHGSSSTHCRFDRHQAQASRAAQAWQSKSRSHPPCSSSAAATSPEGDTLASNRSAARSAGSVDAVASSSTALACAHASRQKSSAWSHVKFTRVPRHSQYPDAPRGTSSSHALSALDSRAPPGSQPAVCRKATHALANSEACARSSCVRTSSCSRTFSAFSWALSSTSIASPLVESTAAKSVGPSRNARRHALAFIVKLRWRRWWPRSRLNRPDRAGRLVRCRERGTDDSATLSARPTTARALWWHVSVRNLRRSFGTLYL